MNADRDQDQTNDGEIISADDIDFVMRIFARVEAENLLRNRMAVRDLKDRSKNYTKVSRVFDNESHLENALLLVECLPQGSSATHPPCESFLQLAEAVSPGINQPECILARAILFEEYASQLLSSKNSKARVPGNRTSSTPCLPESDIADRASAESEITLPWPNEWAIRQVRQLLPPPEEKMVEIKTRRRARKRRQQTEALRDAVATTDQNNGNNSESYSSDYYTTAEEEDEL